MTYTWRIRAALLGAALLVAGCRTGHGGPTSAQAALTVAPGAGEIPVRLDRGDWLVDKRVSISKVFEDTGNGRPVQRGLLIRTQYRQLRGGPVYDSYTVTSKNRREVVGRIDQMGRGWRYVPDRNHGFDQVGVGIGTLGDTVGAIFQTKNSIHLEPTTERRLAFESIDLNGDGLLQPDETKSLGDRIGRADTNHDGVVDFQEFDALDRL